MSDRAEHHLAKARDLHGQILQRDFETLVKKGSAIGTREDGKPVTPGWAMGHFYERKSLAYSNDFEIKLWGGEPDSSTARTEQDSCLNPDWFAHDHGGPEFVLILEGKVTIELGHLDGDSIRKFGSLVLGRHDTVVLPQGLYRRFRGDSKVRGITVRHG